MYQAEVQVMLKPGVRDPQGQAVGESLHALGFSSVAEVRIGKRLEVCLEAESEQAAREQVEQMCQKLLANPVIESYTITLQEV